MPAEGHGHLINMRLFESKEKLMGEGENRKALSTVRKTSELAK